MKKILLLLTAILTLTIAHGQTKKLDCYRGNYLTQKNGLKTANALEKKKYKEVTPLLSKTANIDTTKLKSTFIDLSKKYQKLLKVSQTSRTEFIEHADNDGKCHYERTYYAINKNKITYFLQVKIQMDLDGYITGISIHESSTLTKRDGIIQDKEKNKEDDMPPPPPGD